LKTLILSHHLTDALNDDQLCKAIADHWPTVRADIAEGDIRRATQMAGSLTGEARARYDFALRRAKEFGVEVPE
jgi:hypothetical protein